MIGQAVLSRLSRTYPQLTANDLFAPCDLIAVAGSGFPRHFLQVPESRFGDNFIIRLTEAGRGAEMLQNAGPDFRLCIFMPEHPELHQEKLRELWAFLARFGIPPDHIRIVGPALDSTDEVEAFCRLGLPVILESNRWHAPRLMSPAHFLGRYAIAVSAATLRHAPHARLSRLAADRGKPSIIGMRSPRTGGNVLGFLEISQASVSSFLA